jgi:hypothetical protein
LILKNTSLPSYNQRKATKIFIRGQKWKRRQDIFLTHARINEKKSNWNGKTRLKLESDSRELFSSHKTNFTADPAHSSTIINVFFKKI